MLGINRRTIVAPGTTDVGEYACQPRIGHNRTAAQSRHLRVPLFASNLYWPTEAVKHDAHQPIGRSIDPFRIGQRRGLPQLAFSIPLVARVTGHVVDSLTLHASLFLLRGE